MDNLVQNWTVYRNFIPFIFVFLILTAVVLMIAYQMKSKAYQKTAQKNSILEGCIFLSLAAVAFLTLLPMQTEGTRTLSLDISIVKLLQGDIEYILGLLMFIPLGLSIFLRFSRASLTILAGFALSLAIELVQYVLPIGRSACLDDLILNTIGTMIGAITGIIITRHSIEVKNVSTNA